MYYELQFYASVTLDPKTLERRNKITLRHKTASTGPQHVNTSLSVHHQCQDGSSDAITQSNLNHLYVLYDSLLLDDTHGRQGTKEE